MATPVDQSKMDVNNTSNSNSDTESAGGPQIKPARTMTQRISEELDTTLAFIPMLVCCFISGLTDGTIYGAYGTFVSMQTGNTIFVALGSSGFNNKPLGWARSLLSIGCFAIGSLSFARLYKFLGPKRRGTLMFSFFLQAALVAIAAGIVQGGILDGTYPSHRPAGSVDYNEFIPIALLSFQAAGQIVSSRALSVGEVPTVVITSMVCDLMSDPKLFHTDRNDKRDRRAIAFVLTLTGAIAGGWISKASAAVQPSLWTVVGLKVVLVAGFALWKSKQPAPPAEKKGSA